MGVESDAWHAVRQKLDELFPTWPLYGRSLPTAAARAIEHLCTPAAVTEKVESFVDADLIHPDEKCTVSIFYGSDLSSVVISGVSPSDVAVVVSQVRYAIDRRIPPSA